MSAWSQDCWRGEGIGTVVGKMELQDMQEC